MTASNYDDVLRRLLLHEGGYSNHSSDPGGPTKFGITLAVYRQTEKPGATAADVKAMTVDEAKAVYRSRYWDAQRCDELPAGVDYAVFDYGVNSGIGRSGRALQRIVGVADDGALGPVTLAAARNADPSALVNALCDERLRFLKSLKTWSVFGKGWSRRVAEVRAAALAMARARATVPPAKTAQRVSAGVIAVAGAAVAAQAHQSGFGAASIAAIVTAAGLAAAAAWIFCTWRQRRRQEA